MAIIRMRIGARSAAPCLVLRYISFPLWARRSVVIRTQVEPNSVITGLLQLVTMLQLCDGATS